MGADDTSERTASTSPESTDTEDNDSCRESTADDTPPHLPLVLQRLLQTGVIASVDEVQLVPDYVSKEMEGLFDMEDKTAFDQAHEGRVSHVKTGVWEVQCFSEVDGSPQEPFYVVTGVEMEDRVDMKKLRKAIFSGQTKNGVPNQRRPKIRLAPTDMGERLAGYKSGTMLPICHSVDMHLYLEEAIAMHRQDPDHRILCGSGISGKCLSISTEQFAQIAERNPLGFTVCSLRQKKKNTSSAAQ